MSFLVKSLGVVGLYLLAAKIGIIFANPHTNVTIFWPAGGLALAVLLLGGIKYLPAVFAAAGLAALLQGMPFIVTLGSALGITLETLLSYLLLTRVYRFDRSFRRIQDFLTFILFGAMIPSVVSSLAGGVSLLASGLINYDMLGGVMWRWWRADVLGIVLMTPLVLLFAQKNSVQFSLLRLTELSVLWVLTFIFGQIIFLNWWINFVPDKFIAEGWIFPFIMWAALRTGRRNTALIQLMLIVQAIASAHFEVGYFAQEVALHGLDDFWIFCMEIAIMGMAIAIVSGEKNRALRASEGRLQSILDSAPLLIYIKDMQGRFLAVSRYYQNFIDLASRGITGKSHHEPSVSGVADVLREEDLQVLHQGKTLEFEEQLPIAGAGHIYLTLKFPLRNADGDIDSFCSFSTDITERKRLEEQLRKNEANLRELASIVELTQEFEKKRITQELRDEFGQLISALGMDIGLLKIQLAEQSPELLARADDMLQKLREATVSMRRVIRALRPAVLDLGLVPAIEWLREEFVHTQYVPCSLSVKGDLSALSDTVVTAIFRTAQEILANVAEHAHASRITISLEMEESGFHLTIADNGVGFETAGQDEMPHLGLVGMRERVRMLDGQLDIISVPGQGCCVHLTIPL